MIRRSRLMLTACAGAALMLHGAGLWVSDPRARIEIEAGAGAAEAMLGSSFADMVAGAAQPVSDSTVTPNRQSDEVVKPEEPGEARRSEMPDAAPTPQPDAAAPVDLADAVEAALPEMVAEPADTADTARAAPVKVQVQAARPVTTQQATPAPQEEVVEAQPEPDEGLQVSRRPQARPRAIEETAARQSPAPEGREARSRSQQGNNADRDATRGSTSGSRSATAARQGRDTTSRSAAQGNAAASNYPGLVMRHLARVPRPRADARGAAMVRFSIGAGGRLASVGLARSSGSTRLDRAALTVIERAAPFPAPPAGAQTSFSVRIEGR